MKFIITEFCFCHSFIFQLATYQEETTIMNRFHQTTEEQIEDDIKAGIPKTTRKKMQWAMNLFKEWLYYWRVRLDDIPKVLKDIEEFTKSDLDYCLRYFFSEVRKMDGSYYPPETLKSLAAMIQLYFRNEFKWQFSIFKDSDFVKARESLDSQMKKSARLGNVQPRKRANTIKREDEEQLWQNGILGRSNPSQLINTLIFLFGMHFSLRANKEHHDLEYGEGSQIQLKSENGIEFLEYCERMSKNKRYGLQCTRMEPKVTRAYPHPTCSERCIVSLYKEYIMRRPESNGKSCCAFYLSPLNQDQIKNDVWYKAAPLGIHSIEKATRTVMKTLGDGKFYSNSSLRRSCKMRLVESGISKEVAEKKTGRIDPTADKCYIQHEFFEKEMSMSIYGACNSSSTNIPENQVLSSKLSFKDCTFKDCTFN